jgi:hypothetical protein
MVFDNHEYLVLHDHGFTDLGDHEDMVLDSHE